MTRHPHFKGSMNFYTKNKQPGESWSLDIFGPVNRINATSDRYMLVMVDNVSRYIITTTHKTKEKEEIGKQISKNINRIEKQFERSVKELVSDKGKEFGNTFLKKHSGCKLNYYSTFIKYVLKVVVAEFLAFICY